MPTLGLGNKASVKHLECETINGQPVASLGVGVDVEGIISEASNFGGSAGGTVALGNDYNDQPTTIYGSTISIGANSPYSNPNPPATTISIGQSTSTTNFSGSVTGLPLATPSTAGTVKLINSIGANDNQADATASISALKAYVSTNAGTAGDEGFDVIVLAGQSNMVGFGSPVDENLTYEVNGNIFQLGFRLSNSTINEVILAKEPIDHPDPYGSAGGFGRGPSIGFSFAKIYEMFKLQKGRKILLVPCAYGSTNFTNTNTLAGIDGNSYAMNWSPTGSANNLYNLMIRRANIGMAYHPVSNMKPAYSGSTPPPRNPNNRLVAFLWHQGEGSGPTAAGSSPTAASTTYSAQLNSFIDAVRANINGGTDCPFICGGFSSATYPNETDLERFVLKALPSNKFFTDFASSRVPTPILPNPPSAGGDVIHFNSVGLREFGSRYYAAYLRAITNTPTPATLTGSMTATSNPSNYDPLNNTMDVVLAGYTATNATTIRISFSTNNGVNWTVAQSGSRVPNPSVPLVISSSSTTSTLIVRPNNGGAFSMSFKVEAFNTFNVAPFPERVAGTTIPATGSPTILGFTNSSPLQNSVFLQASEVRSTIGSDIVTFVSSGATIGTCTVTQLLAGFTLTGQNFSTSASTTISASATNARSTLAGASVNTSFTATSSGILSTLTTSSIASTSFIVNYTLSATSANQNLVVRQGTSTGTSVFNQTLSGASLSGSFTVNTGLAPSTQYYVQLNVLNAGGTVLGTRNLIQFTTPALAISGTPSISSSGVLSIGWTVSPATDVLVNWSPDTTAMEPVIVLAGTTTTSAFTASTTNFVPGTSYTISLSSTTFGASATPPTIVVSTPTPLQYVATQEYPPTAMTSLTTVISSASYGNGTYIASASDSFNPTFAAWKAFNKTGTTSEDKWNSTGSGTYTTTNITGGSSATATGSWLQLQVSTNIVVKSYSLSQPEGGGAVMTSWLLLGSTNGTNWTQIDSATNQGSQFPSTFTASPYSPTLQTPAVYNIPSNTTAFNYYRLVQQQGGGTMYEMRIFA